MNLLGIDYGRSYLGLAQAVTPLAEPVMILDNNPDALDQIISYCRLNHIDQIIIGISEGAMAQEAKNFGLQIQQKISLPINYHDETLTTVEARQKLLHAKLSKRLNRQDAYQATLILQDYLDSHPQIYAKI